MRDRPRLVPRIAALTLLLTAACAGHPPMREVAASSPVAAAACTTSGAWSEPRRLALPDGRSVYVERAGPIATPRGVLLLGSPTFVWASRDSFTDARFPDRDPVRLPAVGVLIDHDGHVSLIPPPPGAARMLDVRALAGPDGRAHVVWGMPPDSAPGSSTAASLWHAVLDGQSWSAPVRIATADQLYLGYGTNAVAMVGGSPHVATTASSRSPSAGSSRGILYTRRGTDGSWRAEWIPDATDARYVALTPLGDSGVLLAYTGSSPGGGASASQAAAQALVVRRSVGGDGRWEPPLAVRAFARNEGHHLLGVRSASGRTFLTWLRMPSSDDAAAGQLRFGIGGARTVDGVAWQALPPIEPGRAGPGYGVAADDAGALHVVTQAPMGGALASLTWRPSPGTSPDANGAWHDAPPAPNLGALAHVGGDSLLLTWAAPHQRPGVPGAFVPTMHYAVRAPCGAAVR